MFGMRIRELRKSLRLTQQELADILDVDNTTISVWELGKAEPNIRQIVALSLIFEVSTDYLLGRVDTDLLD